MPIRRFGTLTSVEDTSGFRVEKGNRFKKQLSKAGIKGASAAARGVGKNNLNC